MEPMVFEQFYLGCLAHASYLIGSEGIAAVIDPQRDVGLYLEAARERGLRIAHVIETHLHADFVSGHRELAEATGATIYLGDGSGATFPHCAVRDGDEIAFGRCRMRFLQTPGHTIESVCVVVSDLEQGAAPWGVLTGDTLFIGDVGRPDLSDRYTAQELAAMLYDSLHGKLLPLGDDVRVYPAHGAGSMCGRNIGSERWSTIGQEKQRNYALRPMTRDQFVALVAADLPPRPEYFARDVELNRRGAAPLAELPALAALSADEAAGRQAAGALLLDTRTAREFCAGHVPGAWNIALGGQFASWAGALIGLDRDILLVAESEAAVAEARERLARVGIERVVGYLKEGTAGWAMAGRPLASIEQIDAAGLAEAGMTILDVRRPAEFAEGHVAGALSLPLDFLPRRLSELDPAGRYAVHCKGGYRSAIACGVLQAAGFASVHNVIGGYDAWVAAGLPVAR